MATLSELMTEVKDIVRRPELDALVEAKVIAAVRACHAICEAERDRIELVVPVTGGAAVIGTAPVSLDMRLISTVDGEDANGNLVDEFEIISPSEVSKRRRLGKLAGTCYTVNNGLSFQASAETTNLIITGLGIFPQPSIMLDTDGTRLPIGSTPAIDDYHDWVTDTFDTAIIHYAVGHIESMKGNKDLSNTNLKIFDVVDKADLLAAATLSAGT